MAFGTTPVGAPLTRTFTVQNTGNADLDLCDLTPARRLHRWPPGQLRRRPSPPAPRPPSASASTRRRPGPTAARLLRHQRRRRMPTRSTSPSRPPPPPPPRRGSSTTATPGFTTAGSWTAFADQGYGNDVHYAAAGNGSSTATWTFTGLTPGSTASRPPGRLLQPGHQRPLHRPGRRHAAGHGGASTSSWPRATSPTRGRPGRTWAAVHDHRHDPDGAAVEPGQRLRHRRRHPHRTHRRRHPRPRRSRCSDGATAIADGTGSVAFGTTAVGAPLTRTFTVQNTGTADLACRPEPARRLRLAAPAASAPPSPPGPRPPSRVRFDAAAAGTYGGTVSFATNDAGGQPVRLRRLGRRHHRRGAGRRRRRRRVHAPPAPGPPSPARATATTSTTSPPAPAPARPPGPSPV